MRQLIRSHLTYANVMVTILAFIVLGGMSYAASGDNFILGQPNSASSKTSLSAPIADKALQLTNTDTAAGATALGLNVANGHAPFTVSSGARVTNLNADKLDGIDSSGFLRNKVPLSLTGSTGSDGVITGKNTGSANGVQGATASPTASGVYGENTGGGYGVAGRSNASGGVGVYAEAANGTPLALRTFGGGPPMTVDTTAKVDNLNVDKVDGASILSNRIISTTPNDHILQLGGFGDFNVKSCDHTNAAFEWSSGGPVAYVTWYDVFNPGDSTQGIFNIVTSNARPRHFATVQLARDVGASTNLATVTVTTNAADCVFAAQAVVQPG
jgi:hypothetical protein